MAAETDSGAREASRLRPAGVPLALQLLLDQNQNFSPPHPREEPRTRAVLGRAVDKPLEWCRDPFLRLRTSELT